MYQYKSVAVCTDGAMWNELVSSASLVETADLLHFTVEDVTLNKGIEGDHLLLGGHLTRTETDHPMAGYHALHHHHHRLHETLGR